MEESTVDKGVTGKYMEPKLEVRQISDMAKWTSSEAYAEYRGFLLSVSTAVRGKSKTSSYPESPAVQTYLNILDEFDKWVTEFPPVPTPQRFGNLAFRSYCEHLKKESRNVLLKHLPEQYHSAVTELNAYLINGFGNSTRLDYGTGHEINFLFHVACLFKIGFFQRDDECALALKIFDRYLHLVRKLQSTYRLEPAGSRGVYSLDDFQFVPFIWGSSQLAGNPVIEPASFYRPDVVDKYHGDYLFLGCINFINQVKKGPFFEHSNQLYNLSAVDNWSKINQGLIKMYENEVLSSFPLVQHILFGSLMPITPALNSPATRASNQRPGTRPPPSVNPANLPPPTN